MEAILQEPGLRTIAAAAAAFTFGQLTVLVCQILKNWGVSSRAVAAGAFLATILGLPLIVVGCLLESPKLVYGAFVIQSGIPVYFVMVVHVFFIDGFKLTWRHWSMALGMHAVAGVIIFNGLWQTDRTLAYLIYAVYALAHIGIGIRVLMREASSDLVEWRRNLRIYFFGGIGGVILLLGSALEALRGFGVINMGESLTISVVFAGLCALAMSIAAGRIESRFFERTEKRVQPIMKDYSWVKVKLKETMESEAPWKDPRLTISQLSKIVGVPAHVLRPCILSELGFTNFNEFLNSYRLKAVAQLLCDHDRRHEKLFSLALDSGFGSVAPFNRAFKENFGVTPSQYRSQNLARQAAG